MNQVKNIGIPNIIAPTKTCEDPHCPFHGNLKLRGRILQGKVVSTKMHKTIIIQRDYNYYISKYQRYERRKSKISAHLPDCFEVEEGDQVKIAECRKISKSTAFVVIEKIIKEDK
ncbi:MAG: 30S ribosomal protein S17 [Promethearchaeota archaeon]